MRALLTFITFMVCLAVNAQVVTIIDLNGEIIQVGLDRVKYAQSNEIGSTVVLPEERIICVSPIDSIKGCGVIQFTDTRSGKTLRVNTNFVDRISANVYGTTTVKLDGKRWRTVEPTPLQDVGCETGGDGGGAPADGNGIYGGSGEVPENTIATNTNLLFGQQKLGKVQVYTPIGDYRAMNGGDREDAYSGLFITEGPNNGTELFVGLGTEFSGLATDGILKLQGTKGIRVGGAGIAVSSYIDEGIFIGAGVAKAFKGVVYEDDFSNDYTERSLVDKAYVDALIGGPAATPTWQEVITEQFNQEGEYFLDASSGQAVEFGLDMPSSSFFDDGTGGFSINATADVRLEAAGSSFRVGGAANHNLFIDGRTVAKGIEYNADYSANFTDRSLVDKAYVDSRPTSATLQTALDNQLATTNGLFAIVNAPAGAVVFNPQHTIIGGDGGAMFVKGDASVSSYLSKGLGPGWTLEDYGEDATGAGGNYAGLAPNAIVPKEYIDDAIAGVSGGGGTLQEAVDAQFASTGGAISFVNLGGGSNFISTPLSTTLGGDGGAIVVGSPTDTAPQLRKLQGPGWVLEGYGEDGTGAGGTYNTLPPNAVVPKEYVDDAVAGVVGGSSNFQQVVNAQFADTGGSIMAVDFGGAGSIVSVLNTNTTIGGAGGFLQVTNNSSVPASLDKSQGPGWVLTGYGEDGAGAGADYSTLAPNAIVPKAYVDDAQSSWNGEYLTAGSQGQTQFVVSETLPTNSWHVRVLVDGVELYDNSYSYGGTTINIPSGLNAGANLKITWFK